MGARGARHRGAKRAARSRKPPAPSRGSTGRDQAGGRRRLPIPLRRTLPTLLLWTTRGALLGSLALALWVAAYDRVDPPPGAFMRSEAQRLGGIRREWVPMERIAAVLAHSAIASEDARFCAHAGLDMVAIRAALAANASGGRLVGGSTITQQVAKNVFLWPDRSWLRKGLEAGLALLIEATWTKRRIMEVYLNVAEFAPGIFGAEAAARHHFATTAARLSGRQAARLVAVLPNPRVNDASDPGPALRRRALAIERDARLVAGTGLADCLRP